MVFSIEHADSTASAVEMAADRGWQVYSGEMRDHVHKEFLRYTFRPPMMPQASLLTFSRG